MALEQKIRSLHCGLPGGLQFEERDGLMILPQRRVPFELEEIVAQWIMALPQELQSEFLYCTDETIHGLTCIGWSAFVKWMLECLREAQRSSDFEKTVKLYAKKSFDIFV
jgi:hypothetical protein